MKVKSKGLTKIVIYGSKGQGKDFLWSVKDCNKIEKKYEILGFIDDDKPKKNKIICGLPVLGDINWFTPKKVKEVQCIVAIADSKTRKKIVEKLEKRRVSFPNIIHPSVIFSNFKKIGKGVVIQAGCIFAAETSLGNHVHIQIDCTIGHDSVLNDYVTINPGVHISGNNKIGTGAQIGTGTVTKQGIKIGKWSITGAGTVLINDTLGNSVYVGVPGKLKKKI